MMRNEGEGSIIFKPFINTLDEIIADTSGDGTISAYDAALILQYLVGLIDHLLLLPLDVRVDVHHHLSPASGFGRHYGHHLCRHSGCRRLGEL